jgi:uncharacterized protein
MTTMPTAQHSPGRPPVTVRTPRWEFPDDLDEVFAGDLSDDCSRVAFSLMLPHLEPYLIRTYRKLAPHITDPGLAAEVEAFCGQEAQHHRGHAKVNRIIRRQLGPETAARLLAVEDRLAADYRRFATERSLRFNAAYAEGFEAMTCAMGMTGLTTQRRPAGDGVWNQLWTWHLAEELEHRTVAFDVFEHLSGSYPYRVAVGAWAQIHFLRTLDRLHRILVHHHGGSARVPHIPPLLREGWQRYLATFAPGYDPADIQPPAALQDYLATFPARDRAPAHCRTTTSPDV